MASNAGSNRSKSSRNRREVNISEAIEPENRADNLPEAVATDGQQEANTEQAGTQTEQQPQQETVPKKKQRGGKAVRKLRVRAKKELKQSVIRRMCRISSNNGSRVDNRDAKIMYTNSQFGLSTQACNLSTCQVCTLAPRRRNRIITGIATAAAKGKSKMKRLVPLAKRRTTHKMGRCRKMGHPRKMGRPRKIGRPRKVGRPRKTASSNKPSSVRSSGARLWTHSEFGSRKPPVFDSSPPRDWPHTPMPVHRAVRHGL